MNSLDLCRLREDAVSDADCEPDCDCAEVSKIVAAMVQPATPKSNANQSRIKAVTKYWRAGAGQSRGR
jgi:hypothetical protein